jgi:hypothetical protein
MTKTSTFEDPSHANMTIPGRVAIGAGRGPARRLDVDYGFLLVLSPDKVP